MRDPHASPTRDLVERRFVAKRPDALWVTDITQHRAQAGWVYCAVVLDVFALRVPKTSSVLVMAALLTGMGSPLR